MDENRALELFTRVLCQLAPDLRIAFLLREVDQLSYRNIAKVLEIPENSVRARINEARRQLLDGLKSLGWENEL